MSLFDCSKTKNNVQTNNAQTNKEKKEVKQVSKKPDWFHDIIRADEEYFYICASASSENIEYAIKLAKHKALTEIAEMVDTRITSTLELIEEKNEQFRKTVKYSLKAYSNKKISHAQPVNQHFDEKANPLVAYIKIKVRKDELFPHLKWEAVLKKYNSKEITNDEAINNLKNLQAEFRIANKSYLNLIVQKLLVEKFAKDNFDERLKILRIYEKLGDFDNALNELKYIRIDLNQILTPEQIEILNREETEILKGFAFDYQRYLEIF